MSAKVQATAPVEPRAAGEWYRSSLCARIVAATERARQKIYFQGLLTNLSVQPLQIRRRPTLVSCRSKNLNCTLLQLVLPLRDLARVHIEAFGQLGQGQFSLDRCQCHFSL